MNNKVCSKCGAAVKGEDKFCMSCGSKEFKEVVQPVTPVGTDKGMPTWVKVLIVVGVIVLLLGGCAVACVGSFFNSAGNLITGVFDMSESVINDVVEEIDDQVNQFESQFSDINNKKEFYIGESFENKFIKINFNSADEDTNVTNVKDGYKVYAFDFVFENVGKSELEVDEDDFMCFGDDIQYSKYYPAQSSYNEIDLDIVVGKKGAGKIYCEVPATSSKVSVSYEILDDQKFVDFIAK